VKNSSALGGAVRAAAALGALGFEELARRFSAPDPESITPKPGTANAYGELGARYAEKLGELTK
jgi:sugar (pentulose or hexulose) kinase